MNNNISKISILSLHTAKLILNFATAQTALFRLSKTLDCRLEGEQTNLTLVVFLFLCCEKILFSTFFLYILQFVKTQNTRVFATNFEFTSKQLEVSLLTEIHFRFSHPCFACYKSERTYVNRFTAATFTSTSYVNSLSTFYVMLSISNTSDIFGYLMSEGNANFRQCRDSFLTLLIQSLILFYVDS